MKNPILGILIGADFTAIVHSSAATLGIIIALAGEGLMPLEAGVGLVHLLFNVSGVLFFVFFIPQLAEFVRFISPAALELEDLARLAAETRRRSRSWRSSSFPRAATTPPRRAMSGIWTRRRRRSRMAPDPCGARVRSRTA